LSEGLKACATRDMKETKGDENNSAGGSGRSQEAHRGRLLEKAASERQGEPLGVKPMINRGGCVSRPGSGLFEQGELSMVGKWNVVESGNKLNQHLPTKGGKSSQTSSRKKRQIEILTPAGGRLLHLLKKKKEKVETAHVLEHNTDLWLDKKG